MSSSFSTFSTINEFLKRRAGVLLVGTFVLNKFLMPLDMLFPHSTQTVEYYTKIGACALSILFELYLWIIIAFRLKSKFFWLLLVFSLAGSIALNAFAVDFRADREIDHHKAYVTGEVTVERYSRGSRKISVSYSINNVRVSTPYFTNYEYEVGAPVELEVSSRYPGVYRLIR